MNKTVRDLKGRKQNAVCTRANVDRSRHTNWLTKEDISEKNQCKYHIEKVLCVKKDLLFASSEISEKN